MQTYTLVADDKSLDFRLDVFLSEYLAQRPSRSSLKKIISGGFVFVNGKEILKAHHKMHPGDIVVVKFPEKEAIDIIPEPMPLSIFYEDHEILIVHKMAGMTVHPGAGCQKGTLVNALVYHQKKLSEASDPLRPGIVHRLDKETSGLMVVAKNNVVHSHIAKQFENQAVFKQYIAIVEGVVEFDEGCVDTLLGRHPVYREKRTVLHARAKQAITMYRVLERFQKTTFVALWPKTGRTHQLRVHMAYLGHPILGDDKYGRKQSFSRMALHAKSLGFIHPKSLSYVEFSSLPPEEFLAFFNNNRLS